MTTSLKPWNRRLDLRETVKAYHAFCHFRDLATRRRSLDRAYTTHMVICQYSGTGKPPDVLPEPLKEATPNWKGWRKRFLWDDRSALYDAYLEEEERVETRDAIKSMNKRHATIAQAFLTKAAGALQLITVAELRKPGMLAKVIKEAAQLERLARGQASAIVKHEGQVGGDAPDLSALSEAELDQYIALQEKIYGAASDEPEDK